MDFEKLTPLISKQEISEKIRQAGLEITRDYEGKDLVVVMVLKGAVCVVADLIREIRLPLDLQAIQCSSYGAGGTKRGNLKISGLEKVDLHNRDVLIVDDILDSGATMLGLIDALQEQGPRSIKTFVLLNKTGVFKVSDYRPDYVLFDIPDQFVVGYGLDFKEQYRALPGIFILDPS